MSSNATRVFTATGIIRLDASFPVEAIGSALMDCAADVDENTAVSIDLERCVVEIESIVWGLDEPDALATAKVLIHRICDRADFPVEFAADRKPCPTEWRLVDDSAQPPILATAV